MRFTLPVELRGVQGGSSNERSEAAADPLAHEAVRWKRSASEENEGVQGGSSNERSEAAADPLAHEAVRWKRSASEENEGMR